MARLKVTKNISFIFGAFLIYLSIVLRQCVLSFSIVHDSVFTEIVIPIALIVFNGLFFYIGMLLLIDSIGTEEVKHFV